MQGNTILVVTPDQRLWRRLSAPLSSAGSEVLWVRTLAVARELFATTEVDLALVDPAELAGAGELLAAASRRFPVVALGVGGAAAVLPAWQASAAPSLFARLGDAAGPDFDASEVLVGASKLVRGDLFGLEKHLSTFGAALESRVLTRAADREPLLAALAQMTDRLRLGSRRGRLIRDVADELATNAIYDAPRDADGRARYAHVDRREKIELAATEYVTVRFGSDSRYVGLSVSDGFGDLTAERLASCLLRAAASEDQIERKEGGAGIGLYLALRSADQLVIAVERGRRTEVTALWRLDRRAAAPVATLHFLVGSPPAAIAARSPATIETSRSARLVSIAARSPATIETSRSARVEVGAALADSACLATAAPDPDRVDVTGSALDTSGWPHDASAPLGSTFELADDPLADLRGVHLLRGAHPPGLDTTIARLRGMTRTSQTLAAATAYLVGDWSAAVVLEVGDDAIRAVCAAGDVHQPDRAMRTTIARAGRCALTYLARQSGMMLGPLAPPAEEAVLAEALIGRGPADGVALALTVADEVRYLLFAARPRGRGFDERADHQRLLREINHALARVAGWTPPSELD